MLPFLSRKIRGRITSARRARTNYRPRLEKLDDRCLLSAGALDPTFGSGGIVTNSIGPTTNWNGAAAVAIYPNAGTANDGEIVAAGNGAGNQSGPNYVDGFAVARYQPNGTLDSSFGSGGEVTTRLTSTVSRANDVAIQSNGKIVAAGYAQNPNGSKAFALVRYNLNGSLDATFGSGKNAGIVLGITGVAESLAIQADGKFVVAGESGQFALLRYNTNGSLDTTFNGSGKVLTNFNGSASGGLFDAVDVAIYPQSSTANAGKILLVGQLHNADGTYSIAVLRYKPNGTPDTTFGPGTGYVLLNTSDNTSEPHVAIQADDRLDVAFTNFGPATTEMSIARLQANGALDPSFGVDGIVITNHEMWDVATSIALQADGQIVVGGEETGYNPAIALVVARFNSTDGSLDTTFGVDGFQTAPVPTQWDFGVDVAIQPDGKIVLAGTHENSNGTDYAFALARFLPSEPQIGSFTSHFNPVTAGSNLTLTASNITDANPGTTISQVAFYVDLNGTETLLGSVAQNSQGVWSYSFTVNLAPGTYTLIAQAEDSDGVIGDPSAISLTVD
jgi:uncharacterized delta-60 repeat protein